MSSNKFFARARRTQRGISLLTVAILLVLVSGSLAAALAYFRASLPGQEIVAAQRRALMRADEALIGFAAFNHRLPCPAATPEGDENCDLVKGYLPVRALGLDAMLSAPGTRAIRYMVHKRIAKTMIATIDGEERRVPVNSYEPVPEPAEDDDSICGVGDVVGDLVGFGGEQSCKVIEIAVSTAKAIAKRATSRGSFNGIFTGIATDIAHAAVDVAEVALDLGTEVISETLRDCEALPPLCNNTSESGCGAVALLCEDGLERLKALTGRQMTPRSDAEKEGIANAYNGLDLCESMRYVYNSELNSLSAAVTAITGVAKDQGLGAALPYAFYRSSDGNIRKVAYGLALLGADGTPNGANATLDPEMEAPDRRYSVDYDDSVFVRDISSMMAIFGCQPMTYNVNVLTRTDTIGIDLRVPDLNLVSLIAKVIGGYELWNKPGGLNSLSIFYDEAGTLSSVTASADAAGLAASVVAKAVSKTKKSKDAAWDAYRGGVSASVLASLGLVASAQGTTAAIMEVGTTIAGIIADVKPGFICTIFTPCLFYIPAIAVFANAAGFSGAALGHSIGNAATVIAKTATMYVIHERFPDMVGAPTPVNQLCDDQTAAQDSRDEQQNEANAKLAELWTQAMDIKAKRDAAFSVANALEGKVNECIAELQASESNPPVSRLQLPAAYLVANADELVTYRLDKQEEYNDLMVKYVAAMEEYETWTTWNEWVTGGSTGTAPTKPAEYEEWEKDYKAWKDGGSTGTEPTKPTAPDEPSQPAQPVWNPPAIWAEKQVEWGYDLTRSSIPSGMWDAFWETAKNDITDVDDYRLFTGTDGNPISTTAPQGFKKIGGALGVLQLSGLGGFAEELNIDAQTGAVTPPLPLVDYADLSEDVFLDGVRDAYQPFKLEPQPEDWNLTPVVDDGICTPGKYERLVNNLPPIPEIPGLPSAPTDDDDDDDDDDDGESSTGDDDGESSTDGEDVVALGPGENRMFMDIKELHDRLYEITAQKEELTQKLRELDPTDPDMAANFDTAAADHRQMLVDRQSKLNDQGVQVPMSESEFGKPLLTSTELDAAAAAYRQELVNDANTKRTAAANELAEIDGYKTATEAQLVGKEQVLRDSIRTVKQAVPRVLHGKAYRYPPLDVAFDERSTNYWFAPDYDYLVPTGVWGAKIPTMREIIMSGTGSLFQGLREWYLSEPALTPPTPPTPPPPPDDNYVKWLLSDELKAWLLSDEYRAWVNARDDFYDNDLVGKVYLKDVYDQLVSSTTLAPDPDLREIREQFFARNDAPNVNFMAAPDSFPALLGPDRIDHYYDIVDGKIIPRQNSGSYHYTTNGPYGSTALLQNSYGLSSGSEKCAVAERMISRTYAEVAAATCTTTDEENGDYCSNNYYYYEVWLRYKRLEEQYQLAMQAYRDGENAMLMAKCGPRMDDAACASSTGGLVEVWSASEAFSAVKALDKRGVSQ
jgi:type II secretory pathway pseudopilin PulG